LPLSDSVFGVGLASGSVLLVGHAEGESPIARNAARSFDFLHQFIYRKDLNTPGIDPISPTNTLAFAHNNDRRNPLVTVWFRGQGRGSFQCGEAFAAVSIRFIVSTPMCYDSVLISPFSSRKNDLAQSWEQNFCASVRLRISHTPA